MAETKLTLRPGVNAQLTGTANEGGWSSCNLIQWRNGLLEKHIGWSRLTDEACAGLVRAVHAFQDLNLNDNLLLGGDGGLEVFVNDELYEFQLIRLVANVDAAGAATNFVPTGIGSQIVTVDVGVAHDLEVGDPIYIAQTMAIGGRILSPGTHTVTIIPGATTFRFNMPLAATTTAQGVVAIFTTTNGSAVVSVTLTSHGYIVGSTFPVEVETEVGGLTLSGEYTVTVVDSVNVFRFNAGATATASATVGENPDGSNNGRNQVRLFAELPGTPQNWFIDNFGNDMLVAWENGPILSWTPPIVEGVPPAATRIDGAPEINTGMLVAMPQAQIIAFGSEAVIGGGVQDPLLIRWCDAGDYTTWTASATNQAGSYRLSRGSRIVGAIQAPQATLIWTDTDLWLMTYVGPPFVYSFTIVGTGCGLLSPKARATFGRNTYWMGTRGFWAFNEGGVQPLNCDVWDIVFDDLDTENQDRAWAVSNSANSEVRFFFPSLSGDTGEVDKYAKVNFSGNPPLWDYGSLVRTAGIDLSVFGQPISIDGSMMVQQDGGFDDDDGAMEGAFAQTGYFDIGDGDVMSLVSKFIPDFKWFGDDGYVDVTIYALNYPGGTSVACGPFRFSSTSQFSNPRIRARQMAIRYEWGERTGFSARLGAPRIDIAPSGKRP